MYKSLLLISLIAVGSAQLLLDPLAQPTPYSYVADTTDEFGTTLIRQETGNGVGGVTGTYGYTDAQGLSRIVEYIADEGGFRAVVRTNEPGTAPANPAHVEMIATPVVVAPGLLESRQLLGRQNFAAAPLLARGYQTNI